MADNQTIDNGGLADFDVVADEITSPYTGGTAKTEGVKLLSGVANANDPIGGDTANGLDVDVTRVPADPFGANADASVAAGAAGSIQAKLRRISSDIDSIKTAVEILDNAISGSEMQADIVAPLPAGTNNIGDVDVLSVIPGISASSLGKAEDAVHTSGDTGVMMMGVRKDTAASVAGTDGDYTPPSFDASGRMHVNVGSIPAAARSTDHIGAALQTDVLMNGLTELTPKFKSLSIAASQTDSTVVAAVATKKIRVLQLFCQSTGTGSLITFESDEAPDVRLHVSQPNDTGSGHILPFSPVGWFETAAGVALLATTGVGSSTEVTLTYVEV